MDSYPNIEKILVTLSNDWPDSTVYNAVRYSLLSEGKRIRPILVIESAKVVGGMNEAVMQAACAAEMIHTSSLIVDDIMDNDDYRRGQPSCHAKFGVGIAILASHLISVEAFQLLIDKPRCWQELADATRWMCIGQEKEIAEWKTGSLIRACTRMGAIVGGASPVELEALTIFGTNIGYLFQVRDDILDGERPDEKLDVNLSCLDIFGQKAENLRQIARFIIERTQ